MSKVIILGSGAAPGVPSLSCGWGDCNPNDSRNIRTRTDTYVEINDTKILIDTSPDIRQHLLDNNIKHLDAVLYTHAHADHLHGIDDLREITRIRLEEAYEENGEIFIQVSSREYINNSGTMYHSRHYHHYYNTYGSTRRSNTYSSYAYSARQKSVNSRTSSGGGTSSGK